MVVSSKHNGGDHLVQFVQGGQELLLLRGIELVGCDIDKSVDLRKLAKLILSCILLRVT